MKSCDEMVNSLLERRDQYITEQKRKRKILACTITSMCCVCLVALLGFGVLNGGWLKYLPKHIVDDYIYSGINDTFDEINIQKVEELPTTTRAMFNLSVDDFISMNRDEINEYYGVSIFPTVPSDLKESGEMCFGIYKRDNGTGELYWDSNIISYSNKDFSRTVNVTVDKSYIPFDFCNLFDDIQSKSLINNIEVGIAQTTSGDFYAEFMYEGVEFIVVTTGVTQEELVNIISSIIV